MKNLILSIFYNEIVPSACNGSIEIISNQKINNDVATFSIGFNTTIENKSNIRNNELPLLMIKNKDLFDNALVDYVNSQIKLMIKHDLTESLINHIYELTSRENIKYILTLAFFNAREQDLNNPVAYLKMRTNFINDDTFKSYSRYSNICNIEELNDSVLEMKREPLYYSLETPYCLKFRLAHNDGTTMNYFDLPKVCYGIDDANGRKTAYIYAVQNHNKKILNRYEKSINRKLYSFNKNILDSKEYYDYKNNESNYYPENISDVSMSSLLSITATIKMLKTNDIEDIVVIDYLPLRYYEKKIGSERALKNFKFLYDDDTIKNKILELENKRDFNQNNMSQKLIRSFNRVGYQLENMDNIIYPNEIDNSMHIKISDNYKSDDNLLNQIYSRINSSQLKR